MKHLRLARSTALVVGVATAGVVLATAGDAFAKKGRTPAVVSRIEAPLSQTGTRGAGANVGIPFSLRDASRRKTDVEAQYGVDRDGNGVIEDDEYRPATEDLLDVGNTRKNRKNRKPGKFSTAAGFGASHQFVWKSVVDEATSRFLTLEIAHTPQGRVIEDPDNPGQPSFLPTQAGVKIRVRAFTGKRKGKKKRGRVGEWAVTDAFALNNNNAPSMTIDGVVPNTTSTPPASDENIEVQWTAIDPDSEDLNGNGVFDNLLGDEDVNGNGQPDFEAVAVAFDYYRLQAGDDPSQLSDDDLNDLVWKSCTRATAGDPDDGVPSSPVGRQYSFLWDSKLDVGTVHADFILRARPFDAKREHGEYVFLRAPFTVDNWKVFNTGNLTGNADLAGGRVGLTITNMTPSLDLSDPLRPEPFQNLLVAGGAAAQGGGGTTNLDLFNVNTETAETSTADRAPFSSLQTARAWHTATELDDGRILIAGGVDDNGFPLTSTELYDPTTRSTQPGPSLNVARSHHSATLLTSGDVAFFGGIGTGGTLLRSTEIYRFAAAGASDNPVEPGPEMAVAQQRPTALLLPDQRVLVTGGLDNVDASLANGVQAAELFNAFHDDDPSSPTTKNPRFEATANGMLGERKFAGATALLDGNVLFSGGSASPSTASMEVFNHLTQTFEPIDVTMPDGGRSQHTSVLLGDGTVLLAGGTTDPDPAGTPDVIQQADVFRLGARDGNTGSWTGTFLPVNGDMVIPRRMAAGASVNNGRVFIVGGLDATGTTIAATETYTLENGTNGRPFSVTELASNKQSWAFGAPVLYRVVDPEIDPVRVVIQWSNDGKVTWNAASAQARTIGGDVAELTAPLDTAAIHDPAVAIVPGNNVSDHTYIWGMSADIDRPVKAGDPLPEGGISDGTSGPFNIRSVPFGAVRGNGGVTPPVTVLFNTKIITTIIPLEDADGTVNPFQGGDITLNLHIRDIDGNGVDSNGDSATVFFEYAVDLNGDGAITQGANEFWVPMTPAGAPVGAPVSTNPLVGQTSYFNAPADSDPDFGQRPAAKGWGTFVWDALFDLQAPDTQFDNIFMRVTGSDDDEGFPVVVRNTAADADVIHVIKHPNGLYVKGFDHTGDPDDGFNPEASADDQVKLNEPVRIHFNGVLDPASVTTGSLRIFRAGSSAQVLGAYTVLQDVSNNESTVIFTPLPQSTDSSGDLVYGVGDASTVLFDGEEYRIEVPGYVRETDPRAGDFLRLDNGGFGAGVTASYLLVNNLGVFGDTSPEMRFTARTGFYDNGATPALDGGVPQNPVNGFELTPQQTFAFNVNEAVDYTTVNNANLTVRVAGGDVPAVVPGVWRVTNTIDQATAQTSSSLTFFPFIQFPSTATVDIVSNNGLLGANGRAVTQFSGQYMIEDFGRTSTSAKEEFANRNQEDAANTTAGWGTDPCAPGKIVGLQGGSAGPQGGNDVTITAGTTTTITNQTTDYGNLTVEKGGRLLIRSSAGQVTIRATGDVTIRGTVDFSGDNGFSGVHGNTAINLTQTYYSSTNKIGTRRGGVGYNNGGSGGDSVSTSANSGRRAGEDGKGPQNSAVAGEGGRVATNGSTSSYVYGAGGGSGGGHATPGLNGGRAVSWRGISSQSVGGGTLGNESFTGGISQGSGGGGGASHRYLSNMYNGGGGGGAGAGSVTFVVDGTFNLAPSGLINGRGGEGGASAHLAGSGGGGSGGGFHVKAGVAALLDGVIDMRGGRGGPKGFGYYADTYAVSSAAVNGTHRFGGDGGLGRVRVEAGNFAKTDNVRVFGQFMTRKINSIPTTSVGATSAPSQWLGGNLNLGSASVLHYNSDLTVGSTSNSVVNLSGTGTKQIFVSGDIEFRGILRANGGQATAGSTSFYNLGLEWSSRGLDTTVSKGYTGTLGGGNGGNGDGGTGAVRREASDGSGPSPGKHLMASNTGYVWSSWKYFGSDSGGGGAGNATAGSEGWAEYALMGKYNYVGSANDNTGNGLLPKNGGAAGAALDATDISLATLGNFRGSGGGGGNSGGMSWSGREYFARSGKAGGGAPAIAFIATGDIKVNGTIEARGGDGNPAGAAWPARYSHAGGGAGSAGTVYLIGNDVTIAPATVGEGIGANGATVDLRGGMGGGWRQPRTGTLNRYQVYNSHGNFGGDGGFGRLVVDYTGDLNNERLPVNKWGMNESVFRDSTRQQYSALAGSFSSVCFGTPKQGTFRSKWYDLDSVRPLVNSLTMTTANMNLTLTGEGAQSHPHNTGAAGRGEADPSNTSTFRNSGASFLDGWRWFRFNGVFTRSSSIGPAPEGDDTTWGYETDSPLP